MRGDKRLTPVWMAALLSMALVAPAHARVEAAGSVLKKKGDVTLERKDGKAEPANNGIEVFSGDTLRSGLDGKVQWLTPDDAYSVAASHSAVRIDDYNAPRESKDPNGRSVMSLLKGALRSVTGVIAKNNPKNYEVRSPVGTATGARGADFTLVHCANDCDARGRAAGGLLKKLGLTGGKGRLFKTAETKIIPNGSYLRVSKGSVQLCNAGGCETMTMGENRRVAAGDPCLFAKDAKTKPAIIPDCPVFSPKLEDELEFDFKDADLKLFRQRGGITEPPASES